MNRPDRSTPMILVALARLRKRLGDVDPSGWSKDATVDLGERALDMIADLDLAEAKAKAEEPIGMTEILEAREAEGKARVEHERTQRYGIRYGVRR